MSDYEQLVERAWAHINRQHLEDLVIDLINIPGATGFEKHRAEHLGRYMANDGLQTVIQEFDEGRANVVGIVRGRGGGPSLQYNGHLDTSFTGDEEEDFPLAGPLHPSMKSKAYIEGDWICGLGSTNMLGAVAAHAEAACAIKRAGIELRGDLQVAGVAGEIEKTQIDALYRKYRGPQYRGLGAGIRYLWTHGYVADFAVSTEPSGMHVRRFRCGFIWLRLITRGRVAYSAHAGVRYPENALLKMARVVQAIEDEFCPAYAARHTHDYELGDDDERPIPTVHAAALESGVPYKPGQIPAIAYAYLDMRTAPGEMPVDAIAELEAFLADFQRQHGIAVEVEPYVTKSPMFATAPDSYLVTAAKRAYERVRGVRHTPVTDGQCGTDDTSVTRQFGCPSITWGPSSSGEESPVGLAIGTGGSGEAIRKADILEAAKMYVATTLDICTQARGDVVVDPKRRFEALTAGRML